MDILSAGLGGEVLDGPCESWYAKTLPSHSHVYFLPARLALAWQPFGNHLGTKWGETGIAVFLLA